MRRSERTKLMLFAVGLALMLVARDIMGINLNKYLYLAYCIAFFLIAEYQTLVYMVCYVLPLVCGLPGTYIMFGAMVLLVVKCKKINLWQIGLVVIIATLEIVASAWYPESDLAGLVQYVSYAGMMFFLIHDRTDIDFYRCLRMYLYGVALLCSLIVVTGIMEAPDNWLKRFAEGQFRFGKTQYDKAGGMQTALNANNLANYSLSATLVGVLLIEKSKGRQRIIMILLTFISAAGGFLTISRTWLLLLAVCLFFYIIGKVRHPRRLIFTLFIFGVLFLVGFWFMGGTELIQGFIARMTEDDVATGNGRTNIFGKYMEIFFQNARFMLFGTGVTQYRAMTGDMTSMHNGTQQILVCCGVLGFVVYMVGLLKPVLKIRKAQKMEMTYWLPLIATVSYVQTTQFLNPAMLMLPYIIGVFALKAGMKEQPIIRK